MMFFRFFSRVEALHFIRFNLFMCHCYARKARALEDRVINRREIDPLASDVCAFICDYRFRFTSWWMMSKKLLNHFRLFHEFSREDFFLCFDFEPSFCRDINSALAKGLNSEFRRFLWWNNFHPRNKNASKLFKCSRKMKNIKNICFYGDRSVGSMLPCCHRATVYHCL